MKYLIYILLVWLLAARFIVFNEVLLLNNISALILSLFIFKVDKSPLVKAALFISLCYFYTSLFNTLFVVNDTGLIGILSASISVLVSLNYNYKWSL